MPRKYANKQDTDQFRQILLSMEDQFLHLTPMDLCDKTKLLQDCLGAFKDNMKGFNVVEDIIRKGLKGEVFGPETIGHQICLHLKKINREAKLLQAALDGKATHQEKRHLVRTWMSDIRGMEGTGEAVVDEEMGFYTVAPAENVIFLSGTRECPKLELVVFHGIGEGSELTADLYKWLNAVIDYACWARRDVRPYHEGNLTQIGMNLGPRHARVLGWAKSFVKNLSNKDMKIHDTDAIGAVSIFWSILSAYAPTEVTDAMVKYVEEEELPHLATQNVGPGTGFRLCLGDKDYMFPTCSRAPPEAYISCGYSAPVHRDASYCPWAASWIVNRNVDNVDDSADKSAGSSFVDVGLRVAVRAASASLVIWNPNNAHGTTRSYGAENSGIAITFSSKVCDVYRTLTSMGKVPFLSGTCYGGDEILGLVESGSGAGATETDE
ncbi:hypothetical protein PC9H_010134 [Pleurotus ostreatus]|uniref:Uncharacterized protein n=1 Tax=Pleurotus ostreatus TaxID=5322 RepID=A0A8H6ZN77_PLEOS|nr:uncharacterized protein PC9H_010134 [Pleurotus ostreatus]KAF7424823.1 hypothetical protein PC9H_010134 [Pleurotus ostreatus]